MPSITYAAVAATVLSLAFGVQAQSTYPTGGIGRFPCGSGNVRDPTQCTQAAMFNNQVCPPSNESQIGVVDGAGGFKGNGAVPVSAECVATVDGFFCGYAGATCLSDDNCDNGSCVDGECTGYVGDACTLDSQCSGSVYCLNDQGASSGSCGGIGAQCNDGCAAGNFMCSSDLCDGLNTGLCVPAGTVLPSSRLRSRRAVPLDSAGRDSRCPSSHTVCEAAGTREGFECIDTDSNIEVCGACLNKGGVDCTALPGVDAVGCVAGVCEIWACTQGFAWSPFSASCEVVVA